MQSVLYAIARPSHSHGWISEKSVKLGSWNFHHMVATSFCFCGVSFIQKFWQVSPSGDVKQRRGGKTTHFLALFVNISKTVRDTSKVTIKVASSKLLCSLSIGTKTDDLGWPWTARPISSNFLGISQILQATTATWIKNRDTYIVSNITVAHWMCFSETYRLHWYCWVFLRYSNISNTL